MLQLLQKVEVQGKANGTGLAAHAAHELVVLTARQNALADAVQESAEHHAVVVVHIVHDGEVEADVVGVGGVAQMVAERGQLGDGDGGRLVGLTNGFKALQYLVHRAVHTYEVA